MSRMKALFAALVVLTAMSALAPSASAAAKGVVIASGSSALWQTMALAAYNNGSCVVPKSGLSCSHYTDTAKFELHDTRPGRRVAHTADTIDKGDIWIVWDNTTGPNVWAYIKVDSVVGNRCFFANPACNIQSPAGYSWASAGQKIVSALWGADTVNPPVTVQALFPASGSKLTGGVKVNSAGTDIRPEDAAWAECRVNSALGNGSTGFGDGLDGLGYNSNNASGTCPQYSTSNKTNGPLIGSAIQSGYQGTGPAAPANVLAFNISGHDPFSNLAIPSTYTVVSVGASPITFIYSRGAAAGHGLNQGAGATGLSASSDQLQQLFSGENCDAASADVFGLGTSPNPIYAYLREPLSGTMNTTEATVFRRPVITIPSDQTTTQATGSDSTTGTDSQETGVSAVNPLKGAGCSNSIGFRSRAIGTGEEVSSVQNSQNNNSLDGVGYAFFSFGNVGPISAQGNFGYIVLDGVDPIGPFNAATQALYPNQELPACSVPCSEGQFWTTGNSFPNVRNGSYGAWSLLRMVASSAAKTGVTNLANASHQFVLVDTPDYVPALRVAFGSLVDPGLTVFRAHYQQVDGNGANLGPGPVLGTANANHNPTGADKGGDMGGCVGTISLLNGVQTFSINSGAETEAFSTGAETKTNGFIQIGIDTDPNGTGAGNSSCSSLADRN